MGIATGALVGGAVASIGSNVVGSLASSGDRARAAAAHQRALEAIQAVGAPPDVAKEIYLEEFQQAGVLTPEVEQQIEMGASQVAQIKENEELKNAQMQALSALGERARGGLTPEDRAALAEARERIEQDTQARQASIMQNMQARGMAGSGAELAARLAGSQAASERGADFGRDLGAQSAARALEAARQYGTFAGTMQADEFQRARTRAEAEDELAEFNIRNAISRQKRNIDRRTQANVMNLQRQQAVADMNVRQANQELQRQRAAQQWMYQQRAQQARDLAGAQQNRAGQYQQQAKQTQQMWSGIGSGLSQAASGIASYDAATTPEESTNPFRMGRLSGYLQSTSPYGTRT